MDEPKRILIVEDMEATREGLADLLRSWGYRVDIFDGGGRALEFLQAGPRPDFILLDLLLRRDMNGWQFLEVVKGDSRLQQIPVIAISGADLTPEQRIRCNAEEFMSKPLDLERLKALLRRYGFPRPGSRGGPPQAVPRSGPAQGGRLKPVFESS
jgi:CheY-like chemotaxis protein